MSSGPPARRIRLGTILVLLLLVTLVPLGLFAGQLVLRSWQQQQNLVNNQNVERARGFRVAIDQEVQSTITALNALATLGDLDAGDFQRFLSGLRAHGSAAAGMAVRAPGRSRFSCDRQHGGAARLAVGARQRRLGAGSAADEAAGGLVARPRSGDRPVFRLDWRTGDAAASRFATRSACASRRRCSAPCSASRTAPVDGVVAVIDAAHDDRGAHARRGEVRRRQSEPGLSPRHPERAPRVRCARRSRRNPVVLGMEPVATDGLDHRHRAPGRRRSTSPPCSRCSCS